MTDEYQFADPEVFNAERARLERRRRIAAELLQTQVPGIRSVSGFAVGPTGGDIFKAGVNQALGHYTANKADEDEQALAAREAEASQRLLSSIPERTTRSLRQGEGPLLAPNIDETDNSAARLQAQANAMRMPSLRDAIKAQMMGDEYQAKRLEASEQAAANRLQREQEREDKQQFQAEQNQLYRRTADQMAAAVGRSGGGSRSGGGIKAPMGYRYNEDGTALEPIPGGPADRSGAGAKPLTNAQEKAALELGGEFATVNRLASSFKPEYSGDIRSSIQRQFGKAAGGAAPEKTQEMTRWWSDQAMMDELPKRHELFGAALTATETKSWNDATISPNLSPEVIKKRLATRQQIMTDAASRMKGSVEAGGRSGKQFEAATGNLKPAPTVVRTGTRNGVKVEQLSDGTIREVK